MKPLMPTCRDVTAQSTELLDGTLPWRTRLQLRAHLIMCAMCREYLRQMALMFRALRRLSTEPPSDSVRQDLLEAFRRRR